MPVKTVKKLLNQKIGLDAQTIGDSSIAHAMRRRQGELGLTNPVNYVKKLLSERKELDELIEEVVVPETWFFRNGGPFLAFSQFLVEDIMPTWKQGEPLRILSLACSTGEEPYSIAMAIHKEGIDTRDIYIDAVDISSKSLLRAEKGVYGENSFRDVDAAIKDHYFEKIRNGYKIADYVQQMVEFKKRNILAGPISQRPQYYDVIFCRNLLIYFDKKNQINTLDRIYRALKPGGVLFVGHAETAKISMKKFTRLDHKDSFGFVKKSIAALQRQTMTNSSSAQGKKIPPEWKNVFEKISRIKKIPTTSARLSYVAESTKKRSGATLETAALSCFQRVQQLTKTGDNEKAVQVCNAFIEQAPKSAHGYYFLGYVKNELGDTKASESHVRKAIYIDSAHKAALELSVKLAQKRGDNRAVESFQRRVDRVSSKSD